MTELRSRPTQESRAVYTRWTTLTKLAALDTGAAAVGGHFRVQGSE